MAVLRNTLKEKFSQIPNEMITDMKLKPDTVYRMVTYLYSKPDGWKINNSDIMKRLEIKSDHSMAKYWKIAISSGWVSRVKRNNKSRKFDGFDYALNDIPTRLKTVCQTLPMGSYDMSQNDSHSNTDTSNTKKRSKKEMEKPRFLEIISYFMSKNISESLAKKEANKFMSHYNKNNWLVGKNKEPMKSWKLACANWLKGINKYTSQNKPISEGSFEKEGLGI